MQHVRDAQAPRRLQGLILLSALAVAAVAPSVRAAHVDTGIGQGIGTVVADAFGDGSGTAIHTSVESVAWEDPRPVRRDGLEYFELRGSARGVAWGGQYDSFEGPAPWIEAEAHYHYDVPFVLRWPRRFDGALVVYAHGRGNLGLLSLADSIFGQDNEGRRLDELESLFATRGALDDARASALFAANLNGLRRDGGFSVTGLEGPMAGQPLNAAMDATIVRDLAQVAKRLTARLTRHPVRRTLGVGHSGGALVLQYIAGGVTTPFEGPHAGRRVYTGGNFVSAYVPGSELVFDGVIPIGGGGPLLHPLYPATARVIQLGGTADYAGVEMVRYASRMLRAGVDVASTVRVYQVSNLPHNFAEIQEPFPNLNALLEQLDGVAPAADSDRMVPVVAAALDNMEAWIARGTPPPPSRIDGRVVDTDDDGLVDAIEFPQAGGAATLNIPYAEDPSIDTMLSAQFEISASQGEGVLVGRYDELLHVIGHENRALRLPYTSCRVGGFTLAADARLTPFADLVARWRSYGRYRACIEHAVNELGRTGLYDRRLARQVVFTDAIRALFGH